MTDRKRPWWMLHWPSWLALVEFGVFCRLLNKSPWNRQVWSEGEINVVGWPIAHGRLILSGGASFVGDIHWPSLVLNIAIISALAVAMVCAIERRWRQPQRLSVRTLLYIFTAIGVGFGAVALSLTAWPMITPLALATLAVLDFIGWLFSRLSKPSP